MRVWEAFTDEQRNGAEELYHLFVDNTREVRYFRNYSRKFNSSMSMASLQVTDASLRTGEQGIPIIDSFCFVLLFFILFLVLFLF